MSHARAAPQIGKLQARRSGHRRPWVRHSVAAFGALCVAFPLMASDPAMGPPSASPGLQRSSSPASNGLVLRAGGIAQGLVANPESGGSAPVWPRWQARLVAMPLAALPTNARLASDPGFGLGASATVVGDWYLSSSGLGPKVAGGFRASSGWLLGSGLLAADPGRSPWASDGWADGNLARAQTYASAASTLGLPYLGVGYTGVAVGGGWGVSADVGLVATNPGALRAGRSWQSSQAVDELMRELRLTPLVRLGVSYAF